MNKRDTIQLLDFVGYWSFQYGQLTITRQDIQLGLDDPKLVNTYNQQAAKVNLMADMIAIHLKNLGIASTLAVFRDRLDQIKDDELVSWDCCTTVHEAAKRLKKLEKETN